MPAMGETLEPCSALSLLSLHGVWGPAHPSVASLQASPGVLWHSPSLPWRPCRHEHTSWPGFCFPLYVTGERGPSVSEDTQTHDTWHWTDAISFSAT